MSQKTNQTKTAKKYVRYEDLSKDDLVKILMRLNKRLTRIQRELRAVINILYYGTPESTSGASTSGYKGRTSGYTRGKGYSGYKYGGKYRRKTPQPEEGGEEEEPVEEVGEEEEEEAKPAEKPAEKKPGESKPEKGGS
jgi:uncharacterized membrane protein YukC